MTWDGPYLPVDLTLTTASDALTWTRSRLDCSAWTLTALFAQVVTAVEPPELFTSRRGPRRPRTGWNWSARPPALVRAPDPMFPRSSVPLRAHPWRPTGPARSA